MASCLEGGGGGVAIALSISERESAMASSSSSVKVAILRRGIAWCVFAKGFDRVAVSVDF
jgi:hypothetical protein